MKRLIPIALLMLASVSCKTRQRVCTCTYTDTNGQHTIVSPIKGTSKETHNFCDNFKFHIQYMSPSYTNVTCALN